MNRHVNNLLHGIANLWPVQTDQYSANGGGFRKDAAALRSDFRAVGNDLRKTLKKYEQTKANTGKNRES